MAVYYKGEEVNMNTMRPVYSYIEVPEGQTINDINGLNSVTMTKNQYDEINDKVNLMTGKFGEKTVEELIQQLEQTRGVDIDLDLDIRPNPETWVRPQDWPNLDSLGLLDDGTQDDYIYMTYDANAEISAVALHIEKVSGGANISCTLGHITNGEYIVDETITGNSNNYLYWFDGNYPYDYPVVRVTGDIKCCYTYTVTNNDGQQLHYRQQKILERIAYVPHATILSNGNNGCWGTFTTRRDKVSNGDGSALTSLTYTWAYNRELLSLDISHLYTPNVTSISCAFLQCCKLSGTLDLRHWYVEKITSLDSTFSYCINLDYINLTGWNTPKLTNINHCFYNCNKVKQIYGIENINTTGCSTFLNLFAEDYYLQELDLSLWNVEKVTSFVTTFSNCNNLKRINVSTWNTPKLNTLNSTFQYCWSLEELDLSSWNVSLVTSFGALFRECNNLKRLNLNGWSNNDKLTSTAYMFANCRNLEEIHIENIILTSKCTSIYQMFYGCYRIKQLNLNPNWDLSGISNSSSTANNVFSYCYSLKSITGIKNWKFYFSNAQGLGGMFQQCFSLEELDLSGWKVDTITSFANMFDYCYSLKTLNLTGWTPTAATTFSGMFRYCVNLKSIDISTWVAPDCTNYSSMFEQCRSLISCGDLSNLNTSNATTLSSMFSNCQSLPSVTGLSNWNVQKVTSINYLFSTCLAMKSISIANWNLAVCTNIGYAFQFCRNLKTLNLSNWSVPKITTTTNWLYMSYNVEFIDAALPLPVNHSYYYCEALNHTSVLNILNALPTASSTKTINFYSYIINQLTAEEKAIATAKGWTITS